MAVACNSLTAGRNGLNILLFGKEIIPFAGCPIRTVSLFIKQLAIHTRPYAAVNMIILFAVIFNDRNIGYLAKVLFGNQLNDFLLKPDGEFFRIGYFLFFVAGENAN